MMKDLEKKENNETQNVIIYSQAIYQTERESEKVELEIWRYINKMYFKKSSKSNISKSESLCLFLATN